MRKLHLLLFACLCLAAGTANAQYTDLLNFDGTNGEYPGGSLTLSGNVLYGMTTYGGVNDSGNIFSINTNGSGYTDLLDFNGTNGSQPFGDLTLSGNVLYGMTSIGGANHNGVIFSINTNGSGYTDLLDFNGTNGADPWGSLTLSGNVLYGMTKLGGVNDSGCIFSINTNGSGYTDLLDFNGTNGAYPFLGDLTLSGSVLYGMTAEGGASQEGVLFSINTNGSGFTDLLDFNGTNGAIEPLGSLTLSGNVLYGMTFYGGVNDSGCIFSINTNGSGYADLLDFNRTNGANPFGSLTLSGNVLYGMTPIGGANNDGILFSINTNGSGYADLFDFNGTNGEAPYGSLTLSGNVLYGMTEGGGADSAGVVFSFQDANICTNSYAQPLCIATIDTANNKSEVIWGRTNSPPAGSNSSYNVYRDSTAGYVLIDNQPLDSLSEYIDLNSNPSAGPTSYELSTVDSCGESALSAPHTTIYLTTTAGVNVYILNWTAYVGFSPSVYRIFRGPALNAMVQIDSVANTVVTFHDTLPPLNSYYAVEAVNPSGTCIPSHRDSRHNLPSAMLSGSFSNGFNTAVLGVQNIGNSITNLSIYPNPSNGMFTIKWSVVSGQSSVVHISIVDELGQVVYDKTEQKSAGKATEQLNLENLADGIYSLRMQTNEGIIVRKLVKME